MRVIHVAAAQMGPIQRSESRQAVIPRMIVLMDEAKRRGADLIVYPELALTTYEGLRKERTTAIVRGSFANLNRFHNAALADPVQAIAYVDREWEPEKVRSRYDWLFEYDATKLAVA